jgi:SAM-dependent methyltransferase
MPGQGHPAEGQVHMDMKKEIHQNKILWEQWTGLHFDSDFYDLRGFLHGKNTLNEIELAELGKVEGKTLLHLQCHFGLDTLSLARMGAEVTGVDISETAVGKAVELAGQLNLDASFIVSDVYEIKSVIEKQFDIVFCSYGAIQWLPDLLKWAGIISWCLKPGGIFYMAEFHPVLWMLDENSTGLKYPYDSGGKPLVFSNARSYAAPEVPLQNQEFNWQHGLGQVVNALVSQEMQLEFLNEHAWSPYPVLDGMVETEPSHWKHKNLPENFPYVFSVKAKKTAGSMQPSGNSVVR